SRGPVSCRPDEAFWRWSLAGQSPESAEGWDTYLIVDGAGQTIGYVLPRRRRWGDAIRVMGVSVDGAPLIAVLPSLMRALPSHGAPIATCQAESPPAGPKRFRARARPSCL